MPASQPEDGSVRRLYTVPFDRVWRAAVALLPPERGWTEVHADPAAGSIQAERPGRFLRRALRLRVSVMLDENGFTRVEAVFVTADGTRRARGTLRRAHSLLRRLDRALRAADTR